MDKKKVLLIVLFIIQGLVLNAQQKQELIKDLRGEWLILGPQGYRKFAEDPVKKIFFSLDASQLKGDFLYVEADAPFGIFINQKLVTEKDRGSVKLDLDSLSALYSPKLSISVFQGKGISSLSCKLFRAASKTPVFDQDLFPRKGNFFLDFMLIASLIYRSIWFFSCAPIPG